MAVKESSTSSRTSPPTRRVVAVLDFLARHEREHYGLSELARHVGLSKPTCLGILTTLVDVGYLLRDERDKTYRLGPGLIPVGSAARNSLRADPAGGDILAELALQLGYPASLSGVIADRVTVLGVAGAPGRSSLVEVGDGYPIAPPVGLMYVLWDRTGALERWLAEAGDPAARESMARVMETCRADGYLVERATPQGDALHRVMAGVAADVPLPLRAMLAEMVVGIGDRVLLPATVADGGGSPRGEGSHRISVISAPVFEADGGQAMVASLYVGEALDRRRIAERGRALRDAADRITRRRGGAVPRRPGGVDSNENEF